MFNISGVHAQIMFGSVLDHFLLFFCEQGDFSVTYVKFVREKKLVGIFTQVKLSGS